MIGDHSPSKGPIGTSRRNQRRRVLEVCLVLAVITFAVFGQTAGFGFINYDDNMFVYENSTITGGLSLQGLARTFTHADCGLYQPLTMISLMADYQLHGLNAGWYHFTNVLLHTASVILLFLVLRQMTGAFWRSAFVAAVFAVHPLRSESVAWVAERKDVLSGLFFMLTIGAYLRYARRSWSPVGYGLVMFLFAMGLMSKPMLVTLPVVLLLLDYWPLQRAESAGKLVAEKLPLLALSAVFSAATLFAQTEAMQPLKLFSLPLRLCNALASCMVYVGQMIWPAGLAVFYPAPHNGLPPWGVALAGMLLAGLSAVAWWQRRQQPWILVGWLWYLAMLLPVVGIIQVGDQAHADRYTYLPGIGLVMAGTWWVGELTLGWKHRQPVLGGLMAGVLAVLMVCAWKQTSYWKDTETLWIHALACTKDNGVASSNLGAELLRNGKVDEAIRFYQKGLQLEPDNGDSHNNFGIALLQLGKMDEAIFHFQRALEINPENASARVNLGSALRRKGRGDEAIQQYQKALQINPDNLEAQNNLAWLLATSPQAALRNGEQAVQLAQRAAKLTGGNNPVILGTLAAAFAEAGRYSEAVETAQRALRMAGAQTNTHLAGQLQREMKLYQSGSPFHAPGQTQ
ncbi:MAG: tetratricopeptide repeat protein [Limisphaerales bacterium]